MSGATKPGKQRCRRGQIVLARDGGITTGGTCRAIQQASRFKAWSVALGLLPHVAPRDFGRMAYPLLNAEMDLTWEDLVHRAPSLTSRQAATSIMFEAALHLDESVINRMLAQGAQVSDRDVAGRSIVGCAAHHVLFTQPSAAQTAQKLITHWWSQQPRASWSQTDVQLVTAAGQSEWVLATLGGCPLAKRLLPATSTALQNSRTDLVQAWFPQVIACARREQAQERTHRPACDWLAGCVSQVVAWDVPASLVRWVIDQTQPWHTEEALVSGFSTALFRQKWDLAEILWPHVRPERVVRLPNGNEEALDWILSRCPPTLRDEYMAQHPAALLPRSMSVQQAERRLGQAEVMRPIGRSMRPRS